MKITCFHFHVPSSYLMEAYYHTDCRGLSLRYMEASWEVQVVKKLADVLGKVEVCKELYERSWIHIIRSTLDV